MGHYPIVLKVVAEKRNLWSFFANGEFFLIRCAYGLLPAEFELVTSFVMLISIGISILRLRRVILFFPAR